MKSSPVARGAAQIPRLCQPVYDKSKIRREDREPKVILRYTADSSQTQTGVLENVCKARPDCR